MAVPSFSDTMILFVSAIIKEIKHRCSKILTNSNSKIYKVNRLCKACHFNKIQIYNNNHSYSLNNSNSISSINNKYNKILTRKISIPLYRMWIYLDRINKIWLKISKTYLNINNHNLKNEIECIFMLYILNIIKLSSIWTNLIKLIKKLSFL